MNDRPLRPSRLTRLSVALVLALLVLSGCSRIQIAYRSADFFIARYAEDYLDLDTRQLERWEPRLQAALAEHRAQELPQLAGFFDQTLKASRTGFDTSNARCLVEASRSLYRAHAQLAVGLAAPLLAGLDPRQVDALEKRFRAEDEDAQPKPGTDPGRERRKRIKRYVASIEDWTGPLDPAQRQLVSEIAGRMPDTAAKVLDYRRKKRQELLALLRSEADEARIRGFLTDWLVEYRDLPPALEQAGNEIAARVEELLIRLGASLSRAQKERLQTRLENLRDDLLKLQASPRLAPLSCRSVS